MVTLRNGCMTVVLGTQWGDEGKGKLVDILSQQADICARCQGGSNAGHTIVVGKTKYDFHLVPSGLINPKAIAFIGSGVVLSLPALFEELEKLQQKGLKVDGRVFVSDRAHLVFDFHKIADGKKELELGGQKIGTTKQGIGPCYSSKASRSGLRVHHLYAAEGFKDKLQQLLQNVQKRYGPINCDLDEEVKKYQVYAQRLLPMVVDGVSFLHDAIQQGKKTLVEGANAIMLDLDYGTYPFVTSSNTGIGGVCTGLGVPPKLIATTIGVVKAYTTRVGAGPFPTELFDEIGEHLQNVGGEIGVTTGRKRRCGWLDTVVLRYSALLNGYDFLNLTKLDVLGGLEKVCVGVSYKSKDAKPLTSFPANLEALESAEVEYESFPGWNDDISSCRKWEELPKEAQQFVRRIEQLVGIKILWVGVGPEREAMLEVPIVT